MAANNVISGPWTSSDTLVNVVATHDDFLTQSIHIQETLIELMPALFNSLDNYGFRLNDDATIDNTVKDGTMVVEAVKSYLCKFYNIHHPIQVVAEHVLVIDENNHLEFANSVVIVELKPMEPIDLVYSDMDVADDLDVVDDNC